MVILVPGPWFWDEDSKSAFNYDSELSFPVSGYIENDGKPNTIGNYGYYWSASPADATYEYNLYFSASYLHLEPEAYNSSRNNQARGFSVRCIRD